MSYPKKWIEALTEMRSSKAGLAGWNENAAEEILARLNSVKALAQPPTPRAPREFWICVTHEKSWSSQAKGSWHCSDSKIPYERRGSECECVRIFAREIIE